MVISHFCLGRVLCCCGKVLSSAPLSMISDHCLWAQLKYWPACRETENLPFYSTRVSLLEDYYYLCCEENLRIAGELRWEGSSRGHLVQPLAQAGPPRASCPGFWLSPRMETQPPVELSVWKRVEMMQTGVRWQDSRQLQEGLGLKWGLGG